MSELAAGGNLTVPDGPLEVRVPGAFDISALVTDDGGKVAGDEDFVLSHQPAAPGVRLRGDTLTLDPAGLRPGATRVTVAVTSADPGTPLAALPSPALRVSGPGGARVARFTPPDAGAETVLLLAEFYRRGDRWKLRALGQGYADGLAGLARDFGIDVGDDAEPAAGAPPPVPAGPTPTVTATATVVDADPDGFLALVNAARAAAGSPPVAPDARLASAARAHVEAMAGADALAVESRDGVSVHQRVVAAGYAYLTVGEHLVLGPRTAAEFVGSCRESEGARRTLGEPAFTHAGWARAIGPSGGTYWTVLWAVPLTPDGLDRATAEVVALTNRERSAAGLRPLAPDPRLTAAARAHSTAMAERDFYSHTGPDGDGPRDRAAAAGAAHRAVGENIACGQRTASAVVEGWMNSLGHRANILSGDFTHIGAGLAGGGRAATYWTQLFGG